MPDLKKFIEDVHQVAVDHGWWESGSRNIPEALCLIHAEVSEALESYRINDNDLFSEELADIVIRVFDLAAGIGIDLEKSLVDKNEFNRKREYRHGNKRC